MSTNTTVARTILEQIPGWLRMALGVRNAVASDNLLTFYVTAGKVYRVAISLNSLDLYDVNISRMTRRNRLPVTQTVAEAFDLYADQMIDMLDRLDRGALTLNG